MMSLIRLELLKAGYTITFPAKKNYSWKCLKVNYQLRRYAHHYPESLRHGVDVLDEIDDTMVTLVQKRATA